MKSRYGGFKALRRNGQIRKGCSNQNLKEQKNLKGREIKCWDSIKKQCRVVVKLMKIQLQEISNQTQINLVLNQSSITQ